MEKRALFLALMLTLPLALYGIPYAYAAQTSSTYTVESSTIAPAGSTAGWSASCNSGDYATGGGYKLSSEDLFVVESEASPQFPPPNPNEWLVVVDNKSPNTDLSFEVQAVCQSPITVAGITVPEFGSLYVAIALGAVIYFALSRQHAGKRAAGIKTSRA